MRVHSEAYAKLEKTVREQITQAIEHGHAEAACHAIDIVKSALPKGTTRRVVIEKLQALKAGAQ